VNPVSNHKEYRAALNNSKVAIPAISVSAAIADAASFACYMFCWPTISRCLRGSHMSSNKGSASSNFVHAGVVLKDFTMANENDKGDHLINLFKLRQVHSKIQTMVCVCYFVGEIVGGLRKR
jgi:hypothetical protein